MTGLIIIGILIFLILCLVLWQYLELKRFGVTEYEVASSKISGEHRLVLLADLHGFEYGKDNERLLKKIRDLQPELIFIAGDMIVAGRTKSYEKVLKTLKALVKVAPVYYGFGNHESRADRKNLAVSKEFGEYLKKVKNLGVHILRNQNQTEEINGDRLRISGLEISLEYYEKGKDAPLKKKYVRKQLGAASAEDFQILLAHNPAYSEDYAAWGADLTFCGHNHGGLVRIPGKGSLLSPQLTFFPKYSGGLYEIEGKRVIDSRGLGTHTFHIRIFNRVELVAVRLVPAGK